MGTNATLTKSVDLSRSTIAGIPAGILQKVTIDRILRLVGAAGSEAYVKMERAA